MEVVQVNLHHSRAASANLTAFLAVRDVAIALIQEPWIRRDRIIGLNTGQYNIFYTKDAGKPRTCILLKRNINGNLINNFSSGDQTVVRLEGNTPIFVASVYMPYDGVSPPAVLFRNLATMAANSKALLIAGCDANAHHHIWGSSNINERGESIFDYLLGSNLLIANKGCKPTFSISNRSEVIDLTLVSDQQPSIVKNWRVSDVASLSDHNLITFRLDQVVKVEEKFVRNYRKADWAKYRNIINNTSYKPNLSRLVSVDEVDHAVSYIEHILDLAFRKSCVPRKLVGKSKPAWWNQDIGNQIKITRRLHNRAKFSNSAEEWNTYKASLRELKYMVRKAKSDSWRSFCTNMENIGEASRLRKILSKEPTNPGLLMLEDGSWTESDRDSLKLLLETHFPGCFSIDDSGPEVNTREVMSMGEASDSWEISNYIVEKSGVV